MNYTEVKTADLLGAALDWAVAMAEGFSADPEDRSAVWSPDGSPTSISAQGVAQGFGYRPSCCWEQGGPLFDKYRVAFLHDMDSYIATPRHLKKVGHGHTHLIAACRAIVAAKLGDVVSVPAELLEVSV